MKQGVLTPDIYDPALNPDYRGMLRHYGVVALPCRRSDPDRKGNVESGIGHTQSTPLKRMRVEGLEEGTALPRPLGRELGPTRGSTAIDGRI